MAERKGQAALVIGGTGTIGSAIATRLASEGADVAFTYSKNTSKAEALSAEIRELGVRCLDARPDIEDSAALRAFVDNVASAFGRLDTLIYAAGPPIDLKFTSAIDPIIWSRTIDADLKGCFNAIHLALPHLRACRGSITAITTAGVERGLARDVLSLSPKAAITSLIRTLAVEEGRFGVRANCVAPGWIAGGGIGQMLLQSAGKEMAETIIKAIPLRRMGNAEEIADAVSYVSSPRASYITGTTLFVSGGMEL